MRLWKTRVDCWYQAHRDPGKKPKPNVRVAISILLEAPDSQAAIDRALDWADAKLPGAAGRKLLGIEHRSTGPVKLPIRLDDILGQKIR